MITKTQAMALKYHDHLHADGCKRTVGPRGGVTVGIEEWRVSGACKTWKTRPDEFSIPVKYGLYGNGYVNEQSAGSYHLPEDCPLREPEADTPPCAASMGCLCAWHAVGAPADEPCDANEQRARERIE